MVWIVGKGHELNELKGITNTAIDRGAVNILCIDDQGLKAEEIIKQHDFRLRVVNDIEDIKAVSDYPVIICDISGVGKKFGSPFEGGHIIQEIKKQYPSKVVIACSGNQFSGKYNKFFKLSDHVLTKDLDSDGWIDVLDDVISEISCPIAQWKKMRQYLIDSDVSIKTIYLLEQEYIEAMLTKTPDKFAKQKTISYLSQDIRAVIQGFISSFIFKIIIG